MPRTPIKATKIAQTRSDPYPHTPPGNNQSIDTSPTKSNKGKGAIWTGAELKLLFHFALNREGRGWEQAVPGRTASQAQQTWAKTIIPFIERALDERAARSYNQTSSVKEE